MIVNKHISFSLQNVEVLHGVKEVRNILCRIKRRKGNWIGHTLHRNCLRNHVIDGTTERRVEVAGRRLRRRKHLLGNPKETRRY
jgi:hypothetical protein